MEVLQDAQEHTENEHITYKLKFVTVMGLFFSEHCNRLHVRININIRVLKV